MKLLARGSKMTGSTSDSHAGAFKAWPVFLADPSKNTVEVDEPDGDQGRIDRWVARVYIDPLEKFIVIEPRTGATQEDIRWVEDRVVRARNWGSVIGSTTPDMIAGLSGEIEVAAELGPQREVVRCKEIGCDEFNGWHRADERHPDRTGELHVTSDHSTEQFRCRLILKSTRWTLDVQSKMAWADSPVQSSEALKVAVTACTMRAVELNGWLTTGTGT